MSIPELTQKTLSADAIVGLTFAIVNIPQGMANALLANVNFDVVLHWPQFDWPILVIGLVTIALIVGFGFTRLNKMAMVLALIIVTVLTAVFNPESVQMVGDITQMPDKLFNFALPSFNAMGGLLPVAFALAVVGLVQGAGVSQSYPNPDGRYPDNSRDFLGQGAANIVTGFFQGIPAGGSMSGTAVTVNAGARSRWANIFAGLFVAPLVLLFGSFVMRVPMAALAGLLIVVGFQSFKPKDVVTVWQTGQTQRIAIVLTFAIGRWLAKRTRRLFMLYDLIIDLWLYKSAKSWIILEKVVIL